MSELERLDALLDVRALYGTLEPGRVRGRLPSEIRDRVLDGSESEAFVAAFSDGLAEVVDAMLTAFPDNLLWDLEQIAVRQREQAFEEPDPAQSIRQLWHRVAELQDLFGRQGPIRFRYIHDFIYGFDWARWVAKNPELRSGIGPYDAAFIERMHRRGGELLDLIDANDDKYGPLIGPRPRNAFPFSREPTDEIALHRHLAAEGSLPVKAWSASEAPDWTRPYGRLREEAAQVLGIAR